ncbi:prepilin peptidase [Phototrophicus methaneseepsis]|uniref:Prepilin peptidase n=1 Tax=Phototrophicus methaneseepsis TaxID=2710758 RepID=A0A7S8E6A4_9CHLR|nr:A24 family peptidase [Phototrophicus methaneseepsis]QPC81125.1 prepilin peptidase [Phototrophicus methaneseepsis]
MLLEVVIVILIGWIAGIVVNALADELPYRRNPTLPLYPDGTPRPITAWSGMTAFLLNQRKPETPQPNPERERIYEGEPRLSWRYPLTEILTIFLMLLALNASQQMETPVPTLQLVLWFIYMAILALIIVIDIEHKLILFVVIVPSCILAIVDALILPVPQPNIQDALIGAAIGFGTFYLFYRGGFLFTYIMGKMRGQEINTVAFGYGDVMMITLTGLLVGTIHVIVALFLTVIFGAIGALLYIIARSVLGSRYRAFTALPYGPYIVAATVIMLLYGQPVRYALMGF